MSNIIPFILPASRRGKSELTYKVIAHMLSNNQHITIGTFYPEVRAKELVERFPNAQIEITPMGVKVCPK